MATSDTNASSKKDPKMTASEAGKLGGEKVLKEHGPKFYSEIGSNQGKENNPGNFANRSKEDVKAAGEQGGRSRAHDNADEDRKAA